MSVMLWDSASQAFVEAQNTPMVYDKENEAWRETTGLVYDIENSAWREAWSQGFIVYENGAYNSALGSLSARYTFNAGDTPSNNCMTYSSRGTDELFQARGINNSQCDSIYAFLNGKIGISKLHKLTLNASSSYNDNGINIYIMKSDNVKSFFSNYADKANISHQSIYYTGFVLCIIFDGSSVSFSQNTVTFPLSNNSDITIDVGEIDISDCTIAIQTCQSGYSGYYANMYLRHLVLS